MISSALNYGVVMSTATGYLNNGDFLRDSIADYNVCVISSTFVSSIFILMVADWWMYV